VVILIGLVALGAGNFPCCKPDEGNRVFFTSGWSHVLTKNYSGIAFRVFALKAIISVYGLHVAHLAALDASRLAILGCNQADGSAGFRLDEGSSGIKTSAWNTSASVYQADVPPQINDYMGVVATVRECVRERGMARNASWTESAGNNAQNRASDSDDSKPKRGGKRRGAGRNPNLAKALLKGVSEFPARRSSRPSRMLT
jgi:hypothetical protein